MKRRLVKVNMQRLPQELSSYRTKALAWALLWASHWAEVLSLVRPVERSPLTAVIVVEGVQIREIAF
jgi:hypothetical protein